jgi:nucleoside 2-deoxyribosyltransferase
MSNVHELWYFIGGVRVMRPRIRIYGASKLSHVEMWKRLIEEWTEIEFTARWPVKHVGTVPDAAHFARVFWEHDLEDVRSSDGILIYADPEDKLRGALVEAGMALALGKFVIVVGEHVDYGTWQHHPRVHRVPDMEHARMLLLCMAM